MISHNWSHTSCSVVSRKTCLITFRKGLKLQQGASSLWKYFIWSKNWLESLAVGRQSHFSNTQAIAQCFWSSEKWTRFCILRALSTDQSCQNGFLFGVSRLFFHLFEFFQGHFFPYFLLIRCSQKWSIHVLFLTSFLIYSPAVAPLSKNLALFHIRLKSSET